MTAILVSVIGGGGVGFLMVFFIALCKETNRRSCHVVRLIADSRWKTEVREFPLTNVSGTSDAEQTAEHQQARHRYLYGR